MQDSISRPRGMIPLNHSEFLIVLALADADRHGYGIMREVTERSKGTVRLGPGTFYGAIKRMMAAGLIEESGQRPVAELDDQRRRRYFRLTSLGKKVATEEAERLAALVRVAEAKQLLGGRTAAAQAGGEPC